MHFTKAISQVFQKSMSMLISSLDSINVTSLIKISTKCSRLEKIVLMRYETRFEVQSFPWVRRCPIHIHLISSVFLNIYFYLCIRFRDSNKQTKRRKCVRFWNQ